VQLLLLGLLLLWCSVAEVGLAMTGVVAAYKECLKHLKEIQDESCSLPAAVAAFEQVANNCNKLLSTDNPPKATWKRLVHDMQASVAYAMEFVIVTFMLCLYTLPAVGWVCQAAAGQNAGGCVRHEAASNASHLWHYLSRRPLHQDSSTVCMDGNRVGLRA
jgi:hypothetical protein